MRTAPLAGAFAVIFSAASCPELASAQSSTFVDYAVSFYAPINRARLVNYNGWFTTSGVSTMPSGETGTITVGGESSFGTARAIAAGAGAGYEGVMYAGWTDTISINSPGHQGSHALATFAVAANWNFAVTPGASGGNSNSAAYVDINMRLAGSPPNTPWLYSGAGESASSVCGAASCESTVEPYAGASGVPRFPVYDQGIAYLTFDLIVGAQYTIAPGINAYVGGFNTSSTVDASHTMTWAGVSALTDTLGQGLDYTITASSGFDYANAYAVPPAVPEPSEFGLLIAGLAALGIWVRRGRSPGPRPLAGDQALP